jgi:hypothetical protein
MSDRYPKKLTAQDARQGESTGRMRVVLALSLVGAVVVLGALLVWWAKVGQNHLPASVAAPTTIGRVFR